MATKINHRDSRVDPPAIKITGKRVNTSDGTLYSAIDDSNPSVPVTYTTIDYTFDTKDIVVSDTQVTNRDPYVFQGDVVITITPDSTHTSNSYSNRSSSDFVGKTAMGSDHKVAKYAETYYTVNGKDPVRTKANLYTGAFTIRANKFGSSDNIVLKAKTYVNGIWSEVMKVDFCINRIDNSKV